MKSKLWETDEKLRLLREIVEVKTLFLQVVLSSDRDIINSYIIFQSTPTKPIRPTEGVMTRSRTQEKRTPVNTGISDATNTNQDTPKSSVKTSKVMFNT